ncbi:hypothetical protein RRG08_062708 [Elysia crispata]|uniref:Uncharacterized protein n=1 Tax=Elysia crispata TaxID=231223 RepID=A0AAE1DXB1_9GAST|nr:hypothetical protein RRG08_062708 [Elysia crispata]
MEMWPLLNLEGGNKPSSALIGWRFTDRMYCSNRTLVRFKTDMTSRSRDGPGGSVLELPPYCLLYNPTGDDGKNKFGDLALHCRQMAPYSTGKSAFKTYNFLGEATLFYSRRWLKWK